MNGNNQMIVAKEGLFTTDYLPESRDNRLFELKLKFTIIATFWAIAASLHHQVKWAALRMLASTEEG